MHQIQKLSSTKLKKTCDSESVDSYSDYHPVDSDSTISILPRGKKRSKKFRSYKVEEVVTIGGASTSICAIDNNERSGSKILDIDTDFLEEKERRSEEFVRLDQQPEPERVTDVLTCAIHVRLNFTIN